MIDILVCRHGLRTHMVLAFILCLLPLAARSQDDRVSLYLEEGKSGAVWDVKLSYDGKTLFSCGRDSTAKSWSTVTGECKRFFRLTRPTLVTSVALSPNNLLFAAGDMNGRIAVWNPETGAPQWEIAAHSAYVTSLVFSRDGRYLISGGRNDSVCVWNAETGAAVRAFGAQSIWVNDVAITGDGARIAVAGQDGKVSLWDAGTGTRIATLGSHSRFVRTLAFSKDDAVLLSGGRDGMVMAWDTRKHFKLQEFKVETGFPHHLAFDPAGKLVAVSKMNGLIEIWEWQKNTLVRKLGADSYGSMAACVDGAAGRIFSAHTDGAIKVWNTKDGSHLADMVGFSDGQWLTYTPDGYYDCSAFGDRYVQWKKNEDLYPLDRFASIYKKPSTIEDALTGAYAPQARLQRIVDPPRVDLLSPRDRQLFAFGSEPREIVVEARAADRQRVERILLYLNGRELIEDNMLEQRTLARSDTTLLVRYRIAVLPGVNTVEAVAVNASRVRSRTARAMITVETSDRMQPNLFVLGVGVDSYAPNFPDLTFAALDARTLTAKLAEQEGRLYTRVYAKTLLDREATRQSVLAALDAFPPMTSNDVLVLFFSGHGLRGRDAKGKTDYYFLPSGVSKKTLAKQGLSWDDFGEKISRLKAGRVILFLDACHSGAVSEGASNEKVASALSNKLGIVFSSSSGSEYSFENKTWGHGVFTKALLEGLTGAADFTHNSVVDWSELQLYVTDKVKELTRGSQTPMIPRLEEFANFDMARIQ
jgi:hypothetical protein